MKMKRCYVCDKPAARQVCEDCIEHLEMEAPRELEAVCADIAAQEQAAEVIDIEWAGRPTPPMLPFAHHTGRWVYDSLGTPSWCEDD